MKSVYNILLPKGQNNTYIIGQYPPVGGVGGQLKYNLVT